MLRHEENPKSEIRNPNNHAENERISENLEKMNSDELIDLVDKRFLDLWGKLYMPKDELPL
ncbi:MAG: hypothetical protein HQL77_04540 [Magnetococcales bacterium]|nr:hypothetical protein [Magnetococcales bacterium]